MSTMKRILGGALLGLTLLFSPIARADDEKTVHLVVKPTVGYAVRTKNVIKTSVMGMDLVITQILKTTVKEVKENGDIVEETATESRSSMPAMGIWFSLPAPLLPSRTINSERY